MTKRAVSVAGATYDRLQARCREVGVPMRWVVENLVAELDTMPLEQRAALVRHCQRRRDRVAVAAVEARWRPRKVSDEAVAAIRAARAAGGKLAPIAAEHGISVAHASRIASGARRG